MLARRSQIAAAVQAAIRSSSFTIAKSLTGSVAVALAFGLGAAHAQEAPAGASAGAAATLEEITVTGSRIKRTNDFNTPTPTTVIDSDIMDSLGIANVGQALDDDAREHLDLHACHTGNANFFGGSYIPDLRGLNPYFGSRTLVLVNTRRSCRRRRAIARPELHPADPRRSHRRRDRRRLGGVRLRRHRGCRRTSS